MVWGRGPAAFFFNIAMYLFQHPLSILSHLIVLAPLLKSIHHHCKGYFYNYFIHFSFISFVYYLLSSFLVTWSYVLIIHRLLNTFTEFLNSDTVFSSRGPLDNFINTKIRLNSLLSFILLFLLFFEHINHSYFKKFVSQFQEPLFCVFSCLFCYLCCFSVYI